jgi:hypothetical protein
MATLIPCPYCGVPYDDDGPNGWACRVCVLGQRPDIYLLDLTQHRPKQRPPVPRPTPPKRRSAWWHR